MRWSLGAQLLNGALADLLPHHGPGRCYAEQHLPAFLVQEGAHRHGRLSARASGTFELQRLGLAGERNGLTRRSDHVPQTDFVMLAHVGFPPCPAHPAGSRD